MNHTTAESYCGKKLLVLLIAFFCFNSLSKAQEGRSYLEYDWEEQRSLFELGEKDRNATALMLKDFKGIQYAFDEEGNLAMYTVEHQVYRVNADEAIERYNKVYIPFREGSEVLKVKARVIKPSGEISLLDSSSIKEVQDEETGSLFQMFAMEGVELGSEIEYFYLMKSYGQATLFGSSEYLQYSIPVRNSEFELISPANLEFLSKGYNGYPDPKQAIIGRQRILSSSMDSIEEMREESFAMYNGSRMRVAFKLGYNHAGSSGRLYTWADASSRIFDNLKVSDKASVKLVAKFYKSMKINGLDTKGKATAIENYIKSNIVLRPGYDPSFVDVAAILENKYANENGAMRLYTALFDAAGIEYEVVLTSSRDRAPFDAQFESWQYLQNYAFYFPETKAFLAPTEFEMRYGMIPFYWTDQDGLFIRGEKAGDYTVGVGEPRFIPPLSQEQNFDNLDIEIAFEPDMSKAKVKFQSTMGGYSAAAIQPFYSLIPEDRRKLVMEELAKNYIAGGEFDRLEVKNGEKNLSPLESPFILIAEGATSSFIQKAGPKYLFKLGMVIGPQVEMYQEYERQNEIENDFNRSYHRKIQFMVPEGYQVKNLDNINMEVFHEEEGNRIYTFESSYEQEGNKVTVNIVEYYKEISCDMKYFEEFRAVVNAAADFNKIVLVIERK